MRGIKILFKSLLIFLEKTVFLTSSVSSIPKDLNGPFNTLLAGLYHSAS